MKRLEIDVYKLFPAAARRYEILGELKKVWASVVGSALARHSYPSILGVNIITVSVDNKNTLNIISKMKGNIKRALISRWDFEADENFTLKVIIGPPPKIKRPEPRRKRAEIKVNEEEVRQRMQGAPETLPESINYAISHLQVFFEKRFTPQSRT